MSTATSARLSTEDVAHVFRTFICEALKSDVEIKMTLEQINCRKWGPSELFPPICPCNVVALSTHHQIQRLFPNATAKIIMHGFVTDSISRKEFIPSIYFVNSLNTSTWLPIRALTPVELKDGLINTVTNIAGRNTTGATRHSVAPSDQSQMIQVLQQILEVCNRIDNKVKA
jgi:hypothetical protein